MDDFIKNGFIIKKNLFKLKDLDVYVNEFDKIVDQLKNSNEDINARWGSGLTSDIEADDSLMSRHTRNTYLHLVSNPSERNYLFCSR